MNLKNRVKTSNDNSGKSPEKWDTVIVGSGVGGLAAAICLAREGQKVLVLEQHEVPGGWCHSFYLNGHRFTPGVHYLGLLGEGEPTNDLYRGLGIANDLVFFRMNPEAYEHVYIGEEQFHFPASPEKLISRLSQRFPSEKKRIDTYLNLIRKVSEELYSLPYIKGFWQKLTLPYRTRHFGKYGMLSLQRVIKWHIKNRLLRNVLNVQCGDHGVSPKKVPFVLHSATMYHYLKGGYYPMGGGGALVKAMTNAIKRHKGEIRTGRTVKKIILEGNENKRAVGVLLENGAPIYADRVVSNVDVGITYNTLVGTENLSAKLQKKLRTTTYSCTSLMLFLTVDMDLRKAGVDSGNIWMMPNKDTFEIYDGILDNDITSGEAFEAMFISCTTLKDPTSFDGKHHTIEAITYIDYGAFERFENTSDKRSAAYIELKKVLCKKMINGLEKAIPGIKSHIVHYELGTPLTNEYYINTTRGNVYGTQKSLRHIGPFAYRAKSEIENLFLCGASILSHGVAGASHSGVETAAQILGCSADDLKAPAEDQKIRIFEAEDSSDYPDWMMNKIKVRKARAATKAVSETS